MKINLQIQNFGIVVKLLRFTEKYINKVTDQFTQRQQIWISNRHEVLAKFCE